MKVIIAALISVIIVAGNTSAATETTKRTPRPINGTGFEDLSIEPKPDCSGTNSDYDYNEFIAYNKENSVLSRFLTFVGEKVVRKREFAYLAGVFVNNIYKCDGALITINRVVTSARCIKDAYPSRTMISYGTDNLDILEKYEVLSRQIHPYYLEGENDLFNIGFLQLIENLTLTESVSLIPVHRTLPTSGNIVEITGWFRNSPTNYNPLKIPVAVGICSKFLPSNFCVLVVANTSMQCDRFINRIVLQEEKFLGVTNNATKVENGVCEIAVQELAPDIDFVLN